jgi:hypothetical protein
MDDLIQLVAASFARLGIECPAEDPMFVWGKTPSAGAPVTTKATPSEPITLPEHNFRNSQGDPAP